MFNSHPKHSGVYYVKDNINSLQFKIHFRCINTLLKLPKYELHQNLPSDQWGKNNRAPADATEDDCTIVSLKWQQKLLSPTESELFKDLKNCSTEQQRNYHQLLKEEERVTAAKEKKLHRKKRHKKLVKAENDAMEKGETNFIFTYVEADHFQPVEDLKAHLPDDKALDQTFEVMFVYAALKPDTQLLVLKWFSQQRLLYIYPDFNDFKLEPYYMELDTDYRHLYAYAIEDVSLKLKPVKPEMEEFLYLPELSTHWRYEDELAQTFAMPPKRTQRCAIIFTIHDISGFEYDNVHVRYAIKLPANTILEEGLLESSTHTACQPNSRMGQTHIGYTWQVTVLCEEQYDPSLCLKIYFEIISIDSWQRERSEGFCHYALRLLKPVHHSMQLQCIRPVDSFMDSLNRYFIGGRRKFDYIRFVSENTDNVDEDEVDGDGFHSRYGVRSRNSGQLNLMCQSLTQRNCELLNPCASRTSGMTLDDIMMAYKEARRRLEAISLK